MREKRVFLKILKILIICIPGLILGLCLKCLNFEIVNILIILIVCSSCLILGLYLKFRNFEILNLKVLNILAIYLSILFSGLIYYTILVPLYSSYGITGPLLLLFICFIGVLSFFITRSILIIREKYIKELGEATKSWPFVEGKIIKAKIKFEECDELSPIFETYTPKIKYRYIVNGIEYYSRRICYGYNPLYDCNSRQECEEKHKWLLTINNTVNVYYNPANPSVSVLVPGYFGGRIYDSLIDKKRPT